MAKPGIKFRLTLQKIYEIDTARDWGGEYDTLIEHLKDNVGIEPGEIANSDHIHDAIRSMLSDDIEYVVDLDIDHNDFEIVVPSGTAFEVPPNESDAA